jgi:cytochrome c556
MQNADWQKWVEGLRAAGMSAYKAGQAKNQDAVLDAAGEVADACANCHNKYRDVPVRCM